MCFPSCSYLTKLFYALGVVADFRYYAPVVFELLHAPAEVNCAKSMYSIFCVIFSTSGLSAVLPNHAAVPVVELQSSVTFLSTPTALFNFLARSSPVTMLLIF